MITYVNGDLFQSPAKVLVNPVNTVGVMGQGVAGMFKRFYPEMFDQYYVLCKQKRLDIGQLWLYRTPHKWILNFPTKKHWRAASQIEYIEAGLQKFIAVYAEQGFTTVSFPMLGTGAGGLNWENDIRPVMESYLEPLPAAVYIHRYQPSEEKPNSRVIASWLMGQPQKLPFDRFWRDLSRVVKQQHIFQTLGDERTFRARLDSRPRARNLIIEVDGQDNIFLSELLLSDLWAYIQGAGYCLPGNLPAGLDVHAPYLVAILTQITYLRPVRFGSGGTLGLHYIPPVDKNRPSSR